MGYLAFIWHNDRRVCLGIAWFGCCLYHRSLRWRLDIFNFTGRYRSLDETSACGGIYIGREYSVKLADLCTCVGRLLIVRCHYCLVPELLEDRARLAGVFSRCDALGYFHRIMPSEKLAQIVLVPNSNIQKRIGLGEDVFLRSATEEAFSVLTNIL